MLDLNKEDSKHWVVLIQRVQGLKEGDFVPEASTIYRQIKTARLERTD